MLKVSSVSPTYRANQNISYTVEKNWSFCVVLCIFDVRLTHLNEDYTYLLKISSETLNPTNH